LAFFDVFEIRLPSSQLFASHLLEVKMSKFGNCLQLRPATKNTLRTIKEELNMQLLRL